MLEVSNLGCTRGGRTIFSDLNFSVPPGTLLQVLGPNGSGKTSLLRIICGLLEPENGAVRWQGANVGALREEYAGALTYLGHQDAIKGELTSLENLRISCGLVGANLSPAEAQSALRQVGLAGRENLPARFLSQGQRRRAALARLIARSSTLWLLDEVLASLDAAAVQLVTSLLETHLQRGGIAIVATHQQLQISAGLFQRLELA